MPFIVWNDSMNIGVKQVDDDHKSLVQLINALQDGIENRRSRRSLLSLVDRLMASTEDHFGHEEELFALTGYENAREHMMEHDQMTAWGAAIQEEFRSGLAPAPSPEVMEQLKTWFLGHLFGSDQKFGPHLNSTGIH
jgi:hemerythrin